MNMSYKPLLPLLFLVAWTFGQVEASEAGLAQVLPLGENTVSGQLQFSQNPEGVKITGNLQGLTPNSKHGFHIHQYGDCSAKDGSSAGGHFNPTDHPHSGLHDQKSHVGDLGNLQADAQGKATVDLIKKKATLASGPTSIIGRSVVIHKKADDLRSQPAGDSGDRIACGVIGWK